MTGFHDLYFEKVPIPAHLAKDLKELKFISEDAEPPAVVSCCSWPRHARFKYYKINPSKMEVAPQGCLQITNKKTTNKIN